MKGHLLAHRPARFLSKGFTLLEVMVVIVIVSIIVSMATLAVNTNSPGERLKTEAQQLYSLFKLAHEEAILRSREYGVGFSDEGYRFMVYEKGVWMPLDADRLLRARQFPEDVRLDLEIEQIEVVLDAPKEKSADDEDDKRSSDNDKLRPQVFLLSSGEITPEFTAHLTISGLNTVYSVHAKPDGSYEINVNE